MKHLAAFPALSLLLLGCQYGSLATDNPTKLKHQTHAPYVSSWKTEDWLEVRHKLCQLPIPEQRTQLQYLTNNKKHASREAKVERLLLASCHPELTPGLLRQALNDISSDDSWSDTELYLFELIEDFDRSYLLLERNSKRLEVELEETIEGIREIETDIDNLHQSGGAP